jgi:hypothetical protein
MKKNYKTGSPFSRLKPRDLYDKKGFDERTSSMLDNARQSTVDFSGYRGKDTFKKSLQQGPSSNTNRAFSKNKRDEYGNKNQYPYLSSRFIINPQIKDPMDRGSRDDMDTVTDQERVLQQSQARRGIRGPSSLLEDYEAGAKISSQIGDDLSDAQQLGDERGMSQAVYDAQRRMQADKMLNTRNIQRKPKPGEKFGDEFTGDYIDNVAFKNATMIDEFNNARVAATTAQDLSDFARQSNERMRYFDPSEGLKLKDERSSNPFMVKSPLRNDSKCSSLRSQLETQKEKLAKIKSECGGNLSCQGEKGIDTVQETISVLNEQIVSNKC